MRARGSGLLLAACLLLGGCTTGAPQGDGPAESTASGEGGQQSEQAEAPAPQSGPAEASGEPQSSTVDGPCPYLDQDFIELTVGQRIGTVSVTTTTPAYGPLPRCDFQRGNGEPAAVVDTFTIESGQGLSEALEVVPDGNPVDIGEGGSVRVHNGEDRTDLAAFEGTTLVSVTLNQESSLEAVEIAQQVLSALG